MAWTKVAKSAVSGWTLPPNAPGTQIYDESSITYDQASAFYDSTNQTAWTTVPKSTVASWIAIAKAV